MSCLPVKKHSFALTTNCLRPDNKFFPAIISVISRLVFFGEFSENTAKFYSHLAVFTAKNTGIMAHL